VAADGAPVLQTRQARTVLGCVGIHAAGIQSLAKHQESLAVRAWIAGLDGKINIGGQRKIAARFLPDEVKAVHRRPEICARGGEGIDAVGWVEGRRSRRGHAAHIRLAFKNAERAGSRLRGLS